MTDLRDFVLSVAVVVVVASVIICALCAVKALQFYAEELRDRRRWDQLSPYVPLEPIRRSDGFETEPRPTLTLVRPERPEC